MNGTDALLLVAQYIANLVSDLLTEVEQRIEMEARKGNTCLCMYLDTGRIYNVSKILETNGFKVEVDLYGKEYNITIYWGEKDVTK
jgi:hypothetical protein